MPSRKANCRGIGNGRSPHPGRVQTHSGVLAAGMPDRQTRDGFQPSCSLSRIFQPWRRWKNRFPAL